MRALALLAVLLASIPAPVTAQDADTVTFDLEFAATGGESITGSFTAAPVGEPSGTMQDYETRQLLSVSVDGASYADAGISANYPRLRNADRFTWDAASSSVTGTEHANGYVAFFGDLGDPVPQLSLRVFGSGSSRSSGFLGTRSGSRFSFTSTPSDDPTTTLTLQADPSLDVDGNGTVGLLTDGLLLVRYLIDIRGPELTNLALADDAHEDRDTHQEIAAYLQGLVDGDVLDVDGNGAVGLLTDGLLIVRYLIDIRGSALTEGAAAGDAHEDRNEPAEIAAYLDSLIPSE